MAYMSSNSGPGSPLESRFPAQIQAGRDSMESTTDSIQELRPRNKRVQSTPQSTYINDAARCNAMVHYLYGRITQNGWLTSKQSEYHGVLLRQARGVYVSNPERVNPNLLKTIQKLNVEIAFTMTTKTTEAIFSTLTSDQTEILMPDGTQYQIVESMAEMAKWASIRVKKFQYACLVRREKLILVWHDEVAEILGHAEDLDRILLGLIWGKDPFQPSFRPASTVFGAPSRSQSPAPSLLNLPPTAKKLISHSTVQVNEFTDEEKAKWSKESLGRPLLVTSSVFVALAVGLIIILLLGFCTSQLISQSLVDGKWIRMVLIGTTPIFGLFGLFFVVVIFTDIFQVFGPIAGVQSNSRFFSAIKPDISRAYYEGFSPPHITIQMPVYKEGLNSVIIPTVTSLKAAISHYELNGGSASIFINDDGMQLISEQEQNARMDFYHDNNIGWVARPGHGSDGFIRAGKFKKASNMNFALNISNKVEDTLTAMIEEKQRTSVGEIEEHEEYAMYEEALEDVLERDGRAWARGNIRIGQYILLIDSDTRVPIDCLLYGAAEMFFSPEVAIVQHSAGVMQVVGDYFENGIAFFTNQIYSSIRFSIGQGEVAPFVGHNAFLRWEAVQSVSAPPKNENDYVKFWSESHVSEDFDIALRLQIAGNIVRLACYHGDGFKEGVSLTVFDELARWEKYAYGCNELVFNPMRTWLWRGPFTKLFRSLLWSNLQLSSKTTIISYVATYYAIASGLPLTLANYFIIGWYNGYVDKFYMESWKVFLGLIVVFSILGNVCLAVLRHRLGERSFGASLFENFKWMPLFAIFFGGLSFHLNLALLAHMFEINMEWGATAKEATASNFFQEMPKIFKSFKWMYMCIIPLVAVMVYFGSFAPRGWEIQGFTATVPLAVNVASHILLPFVLNPSLMIFSY